LVIVVSLAYIGIIALEAPHMVRSGLWRELLAFSLFLLLAIIYSLGLIFNWQLPNLVQGLGVLFDPVTRFMQQLL